MKIPEKVLEGKARKLRNEGRGKLPNKLRSLTREEDLEEALWGSGQLGNSSPRSLLNTMWWLLSQHLGLRGCQEHYTMDVEDFTLNKLRRADDNVNEKEKSATRTDKNTTRRFASLAEVCATQNVRN